MISSRKRTLRRGCRVLSALLLVFAALLLASQPGSGQPLRDATPVHHLTVLHTNDHHGHPLKFTSEFGRDLGGLPARAALVRQIRETRRNVLLLDAGDLNTGRAESNLFKAKPDIEGYNTIGYDAMTIGNHEFDRPLGVLKQQMAFARFPFLSANILTKEGHHLGLPYIVKSFPGFRVAILGLTLKETPTITNPGHVKDLVFQDEVDAARMLVPRLRKEADLVIALTHLGIFESSRMGSKRLAAEVSGIDLIVDGHSHTRIDSPLKVSNPDSGQTTLIVQAWKWGLLVGHLDLRLEKGGIRDFRYRNIPVSPGTLEKLGLKEDRALLHLLDPYAKEAEARLSEMIGFAEAPFRAAETRKSGTALGNLVADSLKWYGRTWNVDFALQNGGGIRADIPAGPITAKTVHDAIPFENSVVILTLKGSDVKRLFDFMAAIPEGSGAFPHVSGGMSLTLNRAARKCERALINGEPLDLKRTYRVATHSYLAAGGDGYRIFREACERYDAAVFQQDVLIDYIKTLGGRLTPERQERITYTSGQGSALRPRLAACSCRIMEWTRSVRG
ncbi:MAG: 5'-nucleotidase C-terminal domain-containing protein [Deltaproteobacteria bacterium]|nr:5'-nucleotidase C-terminal domain-containing protein [Deltaproteobacteria bacterium]